LTGGERIDWGQIYSAPSDLDPTVGIAPGRLAAAERRRGWRRPQTRRTITGDAMIWRYGAPKIARFGLVARVRLGELFWGVWRWRPGFGGGRRRGETVAHPDEPV